MHDIELMFVAQINRVQESFKAGQGKSHIQSNIKKYDQDTSMKELECQKVGPSTRHISYQVSRLGKPKGKTKSISSS